MCTHRHNDSEYPSHHDNSLEHRRPHHSLDPSLHRVDIQAYYYLILIKYKRLLLVSFGSRIYTIAVYLMTIVESVVDKPLTMIYSDMHTHNDHNDVCSYLCIRGN